MTGSSYSQSYGNPYDSDQDVGVYTVDDVPSIGATELTEEEAAAIASYESYFLTERDERDRIQKKTFTKWCNQHLKKSGSTIDDLYEDLRDGFKLLSLLQNLSGQSLNRASATQGPRMFMAREKGRNRIHRVQNVQFALDFLKKRKVRLVNIRAEDIVDGNPKLILGLVWSIILHFQVEEIVIEGDDSQQRLTAKKALLQWARQNMEGYDTNVNNFTTDWSDGMAFNVIMHRNKPEIIDLTKVSQMSNRERLANAFDTAEKKFGITPLLDPEDVDVAKPDEKSIITYVSSLYDVFPKVPPKPAMVTSEEWEYVLTEYRRVYTKIIEWCSTQITIIRRKKAPKSSEEAEEMLREFTVFQSEREQTAALRDECRSLWNQLNSLAAQSRGEFTIGPELDINPMEVRWDELNAEADRHGNFLQSELERLKRLEEICKKMDAEIDETNETLNTAGEWLKKLASDDLSDLPLDLDPVAEVTNCLNRAEGQIRSLSAKVEELRSARYHRSEEYYEIVAQLNSRLVDMNCEYDRLKRLGLLDPISIKERRKLRPPLEESIEWKDLLDAENVLQRSVEELEQVTAGVDGASAEENLNKINDLLKSFANFLDPTVDKLENYYSNFDQGTKDYKAYDERYRKWKSSAQDHLASLKRRVQDQQKCTEFLQSCEECSSELMAIIDELQSDDWSDENKDVAQATAAFEDYSKRVQIICRNIDSVLGHGPLTASQISRGKDLIENYIFKLQHEKQMAAAILEAYEVQVRLLSQYKEFFVEIGDLKKQIHDRKITVQSICTNLDESSAAERAEKLEEIKFTFSSLSVKMMELETQSKSITNIKARRYRTEKHFAARTVTRVKNVDLNIARNEPLTLVDSSKPEAWQLFTETGQNVTLPAITITLPPPNKLAEEAVQELKSEMTQLKGNWEQSKANCAYYQASGKFHENAGKILQWDSLPPINTRSSAMSSLENAFKEAGRHVEDSRNDSVQRDYDEMPNIINNCQRHIDDLEAKEHAANEAEKERLRREQLREELARKAQSLKDYLAGLQQKLDNAKKDILHRVSIAIAFENPHEAAQDAQRSINDLEAIRAGSNRVHGELSELEASEEAPEGIELAKADLEQIRADVNQFQALSQVYIRKVQKVQVVIGQVQATENIIARLEEKVNSQLNQATSNSEAMELKLRLLKNSTFELGAQDALLQTLSEAAGEAKALGQQVEQESNIPDPDEYIYGFTVQKLQDRLQSLKDKLKSEIDQLESEIPILKSQENAAEASQRGIHDASRLLNELEHIANAADKELRREHAESFDVRASLSRCDDFSKRLNNVRSPCTAKADDNVAGIQHKMNELQSAMDALAVTRAILEKYQMTLSADSVCSTIDDYEHKMALLQELQKEIPENDPKFAGLKSHLTELPDNDLDRNRLNVEMNDHMNEWNQLKWQLNMALESNKKELDKKIREREHENSVGSLRSKIAEFIAKIEKMSAQQIDVLSAEHEMTVATFYNELQAQQEVLDVFNNRIEGEYKALRNECDQLQLPNEECQELQSAWERVWKLTKHTIDKLKALRAYTEQVEKAQAVLAKWTLEAERFERESENADPDFLTKLSKDAQRAYAATKEDDETFVLSIFAANISSAHAPVAHEAQDRDMAQAQSISEDLSAQWNAVKQRLQVASKTALNNSKLRQSENQTREAGKQLEFVSNLKDRLTRLSEKITKKLNTPTPLELSDLEVVLTENTALSTEVKEIGREVDMTSKSTMEMLRKSRDVDTEIATQLRSMLESITGLWGPIDSVWNVYEDKCRRFRNCVEKYGGARIQLENTEDELTRIEIVSQTVEERDEKLKRLKELQASFSQIEPLFFSLESSHSEVKSVETRMQTKGYSDESFETLTVLVQSLIARWRNAKTEIIRRQTDVKDAFDKLGKFKQSIKKHVTFVENKEKELDSILATQAETSEAIQRKLSKVEGLQKEINSLQDEFVQVEEQGEQLNEIIRDANAHCEKWAESCEKTLSLPTLERYVEIEIETVTRKYDKLGRMVAEQIERLKIKVRETKAQEESEARYEIEQSTVTQRENDVKFDTGFKGQANLSSLEGSGLITKDQADKLELGDLLPSDLDLQLRPWLFCGEEPVAGVILEETGEKITLNEACRRSLLRRGTTLELLEAQAAVGSVIDPIRSEKLSVEEAISRNLLDPYQVDALRRAERAVTGWPDARAGGKLLSLFEAMRRGLVADTRAIRLLEAQIATGGLIDPRANHRVPINVAFRRGLFDSETNQKLEDPTDDTKGFFDPNTQENLTYIELIRRCQKEPETGYHFLVLRPKRRGEGRASRSSLWNDTRNQSRESPASRNYNHSNARCKTPEHVTKSASSTSQSIKSKSASNLPTTHQLTTKKLRREDIMFTVPSGIVRLTELIDAGCTDETAVRELECGKITMEKFRHSLERYLSGLPPIGGVKITHGSGVTEILSIYDAQRRQLIDQDLSFYLLEAQAATGGLCGLGSAKRYDLHTGFEQGLIDRELISDLTNGLSAVLGFVGRNRSLVSTMEAARIGMISEDDARRLLFTQIVTGGVFNIANGFRLPLDVASKRAMWTRSWDNMAPQCYEFNQKAMTYEQLCAKCEKDESSRCLLLPIAGNKKPVGKPIQSIMGTPLSFYHQHKMISDETYAAAQAGFMSESDLEQQLSRRLIGCEPIAGIFVEGRLMSIWDASRQKLIKPGNALELMEAQVVSTGALIDAIYGKLTVNDAIQNGVIDMSTGDALNRSRIAYKGDKDKNSLKSMMNKGTLAESKALRHLEIQIACGGVIEPRTGRYFSIPQAFEAGLLEKNDLQKIRKNKFFTDPDREERLSYLELCLRCVKDDTGRLFLPVHRINLAKTKRSKPRKKKIVVVDPSTSEELNCQTAFSRGLIDEEFFVQLLTEEGKSQEQIDDILYGKSKSIPLTVTHERELGLCRYKTSIDSRRDSKSDIFSCTSSSVDLGSIASTPMGSREPTPSLGVVSAAELENRLLKLAKDGFRVAIGAIKDETTGETISISQATDRKLIDSVTEQRLLEAQAVTGGIILHSSGARLTPNEALSAKYITNRAFSTLTEAYKAWTGFSDRRTGKRNCLSLPEALKSGSGSYEAMTRFLEYQIVLGGVYDVQKREFHSLHEAVDHGLIESRKAERLADFSRHSRQLTDPRTNLTTTYSKLVDAAEVDKEGILVLSAWPRKQRSLKLDSGLTVRASSIASSRASSRGTSPTRHLDTFDIGQI
ncbi:Oidioi.mRNA.OKI2018_I69.XSR.g13937.t1.cds [Oikopleura dioica]|uniref:Oidioi.mRNA.OKI2018_I69.XSR.g13937.t1.cds n=1 Tax=Oikopleura dioica TaxID=34765 RepID=A0ABN7S8T6_OIKDI|nr:Oidioi.mRNA.OKI2018_I69.XSR.g13937.t1.cds [Oikopleura dioica]